MNFKIEFNSANEYSRNYDIWLIFKNKCRFRQIKEFDFAVGVEHNEKIIRHCDLGDRFFIFS